ncbi:hypothetical protein D7V86_00955 [bacterium D16-51]|nr:hypothetical protein D7V96_04365 [bacterium D16-59]RKI62801.1 hypothetical protein D7V86_00955 [bacterium D16-51]
MKKKSILGMLTILLFNVMQLFFLFKLIKMAKCTIEKREKTIFKFKSYYNILNHWLDFKHMGKNIENYFIQNNYKKIAIYGMGELGFHLMDELQDTEIEVLYAVDDGLCAHKVRTMIKHNCDDLPEVDAVIVTPIFAYDKIKVQLEKKLSCSIISLEDVIYSI